MKKREIILWIICIFLLVALYLLIMLEKWGLTIWGDTVDYTRFGTWGQMVSAIGTTMAFGIAFANLISQRLIYNSGENRRKEEEETSVFLWLKSKEIRNSEKELVGRTWDIIVHNSTKSPIYFWVVKFDSNSEHICNFQKRPLLPHENIFNLPFLDNVEPNKTPIATIFFEGKSTRFWSRTVKGELNEVSSKELKCIHSL